LGGAIGQYTSWRWVFWINLPICAVSIPGLIYALRLHTEISSLQGKLAQIDYLGIAVFICATTLFLYGITSGGSTSPWNSAGILAPLIIGFLGLGAFILVEWKAAEKPMIPLRIFTNRTGNAGYMMCFIHGLIVWAFTYYMIIYVTKKKIPYRVINPNSLQFLGVRQHALFKSSAETLPGR
jgi:MFS family permease